MEVVFDELFLIAEGHKPEQPKYFNELFVAEVIEIPKLPTVNEVLLKLIDHPLKTEVIEFPLAGLMGPTLFDALDGP
jgi:hypothetical protein